MKHSIDSKINKAKTIQLDKVHIKDGFWSKYIRLVRDVVVPYQWDALNDRIPDAEPSYAVRNFRIASGEMKGEFGGMVFQDSDVAKWLEAVGYLLHTAPNPELEKTADEMIDLIAKAQRPDGYLNTYFTLKEPQGRWTNLAECHELYCAGHMIEAAVAYYEATGKRKILDVVCRFADYIDEVFGSEPGKLNGYDGHQEIELALIKLYRVTGNERYLNLSLYFLNQRGAKPHFYLEEFEKRGRRVHFPQLDIAHDFPYSQAHAPIREQEKAEGHAVRLVYMLTAMADAAGESGDESLLQACRKLWRNIVSRRMYITGGIGSMAEGESFSFDYDLPNDTVYAETCASVGLIFFAHRMLQIETKGEYADVIERALYNTVVSGMSQDGKAFFYVNPLEVQPKVCGKNHIYDHVKPIRQGWFGCACCPPNIARLLASLGQYLYTVRERTVYAHLYIGGETDLSLGEDSIRIIQVSDYAWQGTAHFRVSMTRPLTFSLALRIPDWSDGFQIMLNGAQFNVESSLVKDGYLSLERQWVPDDEIEIRFNMSVRRMKGHPNVRHTAGKVALQRGPFVYCVEEADNGSELYQLILPKDTELETEFQPELLGGVQVITAKAKRVVSANWTNEDLYRDESRAGFEEREVTATFIPYFSWANRGVGEMAVWVRDR